MLSGPDEAESLGLDTGAVRRWSVVWTAILTAGAVAVGGNIGFVGLVIPHAMRPLAGIEHRWLIPASALAGGGFVVWCDVLSRLPDREIPLGVITGLVGAPVFLYLLVRAQARGGPCLRPVETTPERRAASQKTALLTRDLAVTLGRRQVLRGVDLEARHGAVTALLGPNGAGKTTLLRAILGLIPRSGASRRGTVEIDGRPLSELSRLERAQRVAYLPQHSALTAPLAVRAVVAHGRYAHVRSASLGKRDRQAVDRAMAAADIADIADRPYTQLSGGEQRRVLVARALATGARILVFDEPAASLDIGHSLALFALLAGLADDGYCVLVAMHDLNQALDHTHAAVLLAGGVVAASGATSDVLSDEPIEKVYGVELSRQARLCFRLPEGDRKGLA